MLKKLIKYDFRSTWREFAAIYLSILLGVTVFPFIAKNVSNNLINATMGLIAFAIVVATFVVTIGSLFKIFNKNIFSAEGYLTMTLPVSEIQIVVSKLAVSTGWIILTGAVATLGMFIFASVMSPEMVPQMFEALKQVMAALDGRSVLAGLLLILFLVALILKEAAKLFLACSIAHLKQLNRFRIPAGILSFFLFTWLEALVVDAIGWDANFAIGGPGAMTTECGAKNIITNLDSFITALELGTLFQMGFTALFAAGTIYLLKRKLNLD
ncbi:MAG: hypothetical protein PHT29_03310 [Eubacteriales bacterium]|jgi:hypothetical protein|nr:hypothetical protein [Eubacteriales bacterium]MDD3864488.1 hypothetical protein [Eubacteriales bacterium]MDD4445803.1 hypothetical protein [Eubacteriales bacterium]